MSDTETPTNTSDSSTGVPSKKGPGTPLWKPGQSGNPNGRPKGSKNQVTVLTQKIQELLLKDLSNEADTLLQVALEKAKEGDKVLLKFFLERFLPPASASIEGLDPSKNQLQIIISPMQNSTVSTDTVEEAEYEEVVDESNSKGKE